METETDVLKLVHLLEPSPERRPDWLQAHFAWLSGLTLFGLVSIRIFNVANFDSTTAHGLIESAGPVQVAFAVLVDNVQNLFALLTTAIAGYSVWYAERRSLRVAGLTLAVVIGSISLLFLSWINAIALILLFLFIASIPLIRKFVVKVEKKEPEEGQPEDSTTPQPHAFLEAQGLEVLWDSMAQEIRLLHRQIPKETSKFETMIQDGASAEKLMAQLSKGNALIWRSFIMLHKMKRLDEDAARKRRLGRNELAFGGLVGFAVYFGVIFLLPFLLDRSLWLPAEKIMRGEEEIVGYVIDDSEGWMTVLTHSDRRLIRFPSDRVMNRELCAASSRIRPATLVEKLDGQNPKHSYELCSGTPRQNTNAYLSGIALAFEP